MSARVEIYPDTHSLTQAAAQHFIDQAQTNIKTQGRFNVALAGGSTPRAMYHTLAESYRDEIDWSQVDFFWGDERSVPPDHPDSNYRMAYETLLKPLSIEPQHIHRIKGELVSQEAADLYEQVLRQEIPTKSPQLDLIFLGMGPDGHTASLFPDTSALDETKRWVISNWVEKLDTWRITITAPFINTAKQVTFLVAGENKAEALSQVLEGPYKPSAYPSQLIQPTSGNLRYLLDQSAAGRLTYTA